MAKIAIELERALARRATAGDAGKVTARVLAQGDGWTVEDVVCTSDPRDRPFEEQHSCVRIAIVAAGSFQYRSASSRELMTPDSVLLGNADRYFGIHCDIADAAMGMAFASTLSGASRQKYLAT